MENYKEIAENLALTIDNLIEARLRYYHSSELDYNRKWFIKGELENLIKTRENLSYILGELLREHLGGI